MIGSFASAADDYRRWGLSPIPVLAKQKRPAIPAWQKFCTTPASEAEWQTWLSKYAKANIGVALGTQVNGNRQVAAIDIDDEELVEPVKAALPYLGPMKKGAKGLTIFCLLDTLTTNRKFRRTASDGKPELKPSVEILAHGSQTVMPPSVHPSGAVYIWISGQDMPVEAWPFVNDAVLDEITALCRGKGEHFAALNSMVWLGVGGGGNTHDVCVAAVASLVSRSWADADIVERIVRAKRAACDRAGQLYEWPQAEATIREWIDSARQKGMAERPVTRKLPAERVMAAWALAYLGGAESVIHLNGQLRQYRDGHWPLVDQAGLMRAMYAHDAGLREKEVRTAVSILETFTETASFGRTPDTEPRDDPKRQRVCLQNGTLNLRTGALERWAPEHELLHQLPFEWDDEAECPLYDRVVMETFNGNGFSVQLWDEFCGLTLVDDMTFQKVLFVRGPGGNGKGTMARVLRNLHAPSAVGSVAITALNNERARTSLIGKLVNISGEQSRLNTVSDTYLKKITGGDPIDTRKLYGETLNNVHLAVRFLELVNEMPTTYDSSYALYRRLVILDCPNKVQVPDPDLDRKLMRERPGILRRLVAAVKRLYERGRFLTPEQSDIEVDLYLTENDPVSYWLRDQVEKIHDWTPSRELYADFRAWHQQMGYERMVPEVVWGRRVSALGFPSALMRFGVTACRARQLRVKAGQEHRL